MHTSLDGLKTDGCSKTFFFKKNLVFGIDKNIRGVIDFINFRKLVHPNLYVTLQVAFTISISLVTCKRSFLCTYVLNNKFDED